MHAITLNTDWLQDMWNKNNTPITFSPISYNLPPNKAWGIAAVKRKAPDGKWYWKDTTPQAVERFLAWQIRHDRACVDECAGRGAL